MIISLCERSLEKLPEDKSSTDLNWKKHFGYRHETGAASVETPGSLSHMPEYEGKRGREDGKEKDNRSCEMTGEAGFSSWQRGQIKLLLSSLVLAFHAPELVVFGAVQRKNYYHELIFPALKTVMQHHYIQEKELLLETASGHSKGRNIATDMALSSGTAELHMKNIHKMQPAVHPQCGPLLLCDTRSNPIDLCSSSADSSACFDSPATPEISPI